MISNADRAVLNQLAEHGDVHTIPRPVLHYFYGDKEQLYDIAERLEKPGWKEVELAKGDADHRLVATKLTDLSDSSVELMMKEVDEALVGLSIEYDGWETSVELSN